MEPQRWVSSVLFPIFDMISLVFPGECVDRFVDIRPSSWEINNNIDNNV